VMYVKWRDLRGRSQGEGARLGKPHARPRAGVRAPIVAIRRNADGIRREKPGNAGGAKGCSKVET
jgi:hypothetical protein